MRRAGHAAEWACSVRVGWLLRVAVLLLWSRPATGKGIFYDSYRISGVYYRDNSTVTYWEYASLKTFEYPFADVPSLPMLPGYNSHSILSFALVSSTGDVNFLTMPAGLGGVPHVIPLVGVAKPAGSQVDFELVLIDSNHYMMTINTSISPLSSFINCSNSLVLDPAVGVPRGRYGLVGTEDFSTSIFTVGKLTINLLNSILIIFEGRLFKLDCPLGNLSAIDLASGQLFSIQLPKFRAPANTVHTRNVGGRTFLLVEGNGTWSIKVLLNTSQTVDVQPVLSTNCSVFLPAIIEGFANMTGIIFHILTTPFGICSCFFRHNFSMGSCTKHQLFNPIGAQTALGFPNEHLFYYSVEAIGKSSVIRYNLTSKSSLPAFFVSSPFVQRVVDTGQRDGLESFAKRFPPMLPPCSGTDTPTLTETRSLTAVDYCSNRTTYIVNVGETCDVGPAPSAGCVGCQVRDGYECRGQPSVCRCTAGRCPTAVAVCNFNGKVEASLGEECDLGPATLPANGCHACMKVPGFECQQSGCIRTGATRCYNGVIDSNDNEECDSGPVYTEGCLGCRVTPGYNCSCTNKNGACASACGKAISPPPPPAARVPYVKPSLPPTSGVVGATRWGNIAGIIAGVIGVVLLVVGVAVLVLRRARLRVNKEAKERELYSTYDPIDGERPEEPVDTYGDRSLSQNTFSVKSSETFESAHLSLTTTISQSSTGST